jgi:hypothetical protein
MYIQYRGFSIEAASRVYAYHVIDPPQGSREFTVDIQTNELHSPPVKIQDGPGMCYARLKQELAGETSDSPAETHLHITSGDIREYVERTYPKPVKKWGAAPTQ